ncbi:hypothetical protein GOP47_0015223 [Adiantum capillus-veneris]|uniref:Uncharacterized protein n=1 Tax=Adiantum capillus-veneris TaxID=13818 RepID=A0A9D4UK01_ADICA|nr:hypothetical protein GOP47_0015223 [Adiantum capillus-veneris]
MDVHISSNTIEEEPNCSQVPCSEEEPDCSQVPCTPMDDVACDVASVLTNLGADLPPPLTNPSVIEILKVPHENVTIGQVQGEAFVDYTNSLILTSSQYIESMKAKQAKREQLDQLQEERRKQKEQKRKETMELSLHRKQQKEEEKLKRAAKRQWDAQQIQFEHKMRAILWEGETPHAPLHPLHVPNIWQKARRAARLQALGLKKASRKDTCSQA